jgi:membrane protein implicated in regulation of membrane protease activity
MTILETVYLVCAIVGGVLFILRAILFFYGLDTHGDLDSAGFDAGHVDLHMDGGLDADIAHDIHTDIGHADIGHADTDATDHAHDTDASFQYISLQGLTAFFLMFGLVGLATVRGGLNVILTIICGAAAGIFTMWVIGQIFAFMGRMQSEGTLRMENAVGQEGKVYLTIPKGGTGKVNVVVQGSLREFNAVAESKTKIATGERVKVVQIANNNTLVVKKIE